MPLLPLRLLFLMLSAGISGWKEIDASSKTKLVYREIFCFLKCD
ncbi:hypothetical protein LINGRAHAP2_LOCUS22544 [Linum grandiflorum]